MDSSVELELKTLENFEFDDYVEKLHPAEAAELIDNHIGRHVTGCDFCLAHIDAWSKMKQDLLLDTIHRVQPHVSKMVEWLQTENPTISLDHTKGAPILDGMALFTDSIYKSPHWSIDEKYIMYWAGYLIDGSLAGKNMSFYRRTGKKI